MNYLVAAILVVLTAASARAQTAGAGTASSSCDLPSAPGVSAQTLTSSQRTRGYRLFVPPGYDGHTRLPVVLDLHGSGGSSVGQASNSGLEALAATERFLVATL